MAITDKGFHFIGGAEAEKTVIVKKGSRLACGFHNPEQKTSMKKLLKNDVYWEGGYIKTGKVIYDK